MEIRYFDNSATTRVKEEVFKEMVPYLSIEYGNPSSIYKIGRSAKRAIEEARKRVEEHNSCVAIHLGSDDKDINAECIYKAVDEAIRQVSSDGISHIELIMDSVKPFEEILDIHKMTSVFEACGYIAAFRREREEISRGVVVKYVRSVKIIW